MRVLAFDLSLTASGWATGEAGNATGHGLILGRHDGVRRLIENRNAVCDKIDQVKPDLVVFEDLAFSRNMSFAKEIAGMSYMIRAELETDKLPYVVISPTSLKKFIVGTAGSVKNKITKELVMLNLYKRFDIETSDNNEADACGLCFIGMALAGDWEPKTDPQRQVLEGVRKSNAAVLANLRVVHGGQQQEALSGW